MQLRFIGETYLKKHPISENELFPEDKVLKQKGSTEPIAAYLPIEDNEHFRVLDTNDSEWYVYCLHAQLEISHEQSPSLGVLPIQDTLLKLEPKVIAPNSSSENMVKIENKKPLQLDYYYAATYPTEHCKVSLMKPINGNTTWYIYGSHFVLALASMLPLPPGSAGPAVEGVGGAYFCDKYPSWCY
jgi:hypothetical protein